MNAPAMVTSWRSSVIAGQPHAWATRDRGSRQWSCGSPSQRSVGGVHGARRWTSDHSRSQAGSEPLERVHRQGGVGRRVGGNAGTLLASAPMLRAPRRARFATPRVWRGDYGGPDLFEEVPMHSRPFAALIAAVTLALAGYGVAAAGTTEPPAGSGTPGAHGDQRRQRWSIPPGRLGTTDTTEATVDTTAAPGHGADGADRPPCAHRRFGQLPGERAARPDLRPGLGRSASTSATSPAIGSTGGVPRRHRER